MSNLAIDFVTVVGAMMWASAVSVSIVAVIFGEVDDIWAGLVTTVGLVGVILFALGTGL